MKRLFFLITLISFSWSKALFADMLPENLLSIVKTAGNATPDQITAILGKPIKVEETRNKSIWYFDGGSVNVVIWWSKKTGDFEQLAMTAKATTAATNFDEKLSAQIQSGKTDLTQTLKLLGTPSSMTIKGTRQELHYVYTYHMLRLFYRNNILADFTLIGKNATNRPN